MRRNAMKKTACAIALLMGGAALAQTGTDTSAPSTTAAPVAGKKVEASNANPARDAKGVEVISSAAVVPPGFNGLPGDATGGPLLDPATGEPIAEATPPPCSATVTDRCIQTHERGIRG